MLLLDHLVSLQKLQKLYYYHGYLQLRQLLAYITFHISIFLSNVSFMELQAVTTKRAVSVSINNSTYFWMSFNTNFLERGGNIIIMDNRLDNQYYKHYKDR